MTADRSPSSTCHREPSTRRGNNISPPGRSHIWRETSNAPPIAKFSASPGRTYTSTDSTSSSVKRGVPAPRRSSRRIGWILPFMGKGRTRNSSWTGSSRRPSTSSAIPSDSTTAGTPNASCPSPTASWTWIGRVQPSAKAVEDVCLLGPEGG